MISQFFFLSEQKIDLHNFLLTVFFQRDVWLMKISNYKFVFENFSIETDFEKFLITLEVQ